MRYALMFLLIVSVLTGCITGRVTDDYKAQSLATDPPEGMGRITVFINSRPNRGGYYVFVAAYSGFVSRDSYTVFDLPPGTYRVYVGNLSTDVPLRAGEERAVLYRNWQKGVRPIGLITPESAEWYRERFDMVWNSSLPESAKR